MGRRREAATDAGPPPSTTKGISEGARAGPSPGPRRPHSDRISNGENSLPRGGPCGRVPVTGTDLCG